MEKQGIITGIGNEITPEIDAVVNDYIVGKNTILKGLELNGNILSAGTCILCGYRGTLENSQTVDGNYVYGKFVIGVNETDSFSIFTSSSSNEPTDGIINPTSITSAGTYYLRLYANGASQVDSERYPNQANTSDRARDLIASGIIDSTATTPTEKDGKGNVVVNLHNTQPNRVANTEYVHNQIEKEIDYQSTSMTINFGSQYASNVTVNENIIRKKARYVLFSLRLTWKTILINLQEGQVIATLPNGFNTERQGQNIITYGESSASGRGDVFQYKVVLEIANNELKVKTLTQITTSTAPSSGKDGILEILNAGYEI